MPRTRAVNGVKLEWVRCLGPGKEHRFRSSDVVRNRVCPACRKKLDASYSWARDGVTLAGEWR